MVRFILTVVFLSLVVSTFAFSGADMLAQTGDPEALGTRAAINCGNFRPFDQGGGDDAQALFDAFPEDPYDLESDSDNDPDDACESPTDLGSLPERVNCQMFLPADQGGQRHAQALFEFTRADGDAYNLDANGDGVACTPRRATSPAPTPAPSGPTLGDRTCSADRPQIKTSFHDVCSGSHARVIQPGYGTLDVTLPASITFTPLQGAPAALGNPAGGNPSVTTRHRSRLSNQPKREKRLRKRAMRSAERKSLTIFAYRYR